MPNDGDSVGLRDDLLGQMPVNFRSQAFPKEGVEGALGYAERYFPIVLDLVLDFGVMTLDEGPQDDTKAVLLVLGDKRSESDESPGLRWINLIGPIGLSPNRPNALSPLGLVSLRMRC